MDLRALQKMTAAKLREEAMKIPEITGASGMSKEELIRSIAQVRGISLEGRRRGGGERSGLKRESRELRENIREAFAAGDAARAKRLRRERKLVKRELRRPVRVESETPTEVSGT